MLRPRHVGYAAGLGPDDVATTKPSAKGLVLAAALARRIKDLLWGVYGLTLLFIEQTAFNPKFYKGTRNTAGVSLSLRSS